MITLFVVDLSAASRTNIVDQLNHLLHPDVNEFHVVPRVTVKPLAPQELKFHGTPDVCVIGPELIAHDITEVARIRELVPSALVWAQTPKEYSGLSNIDQLARMGADDVLPYDLSKADLLRKIVLLSKRATAKKTGKLIVVDGGKGGVGVTSVAAAVGEALYSHGKKVALLDFDFETQDLSRFLQVRPFVNENLRLLFDEHRPVSEEFVKQCLTGLVDEGGDFAAMPPPPESDDLYESHARHSRTLLAILEIIDANFDFVICDIGNARGAIARSLYRAADSVLFVLNSDPATMFASVEKISRIRSQLSTGAEITLVENGTFAGGLPSRLLRQEFNRVTRSDEAAWLEKTIPFCRLGGRWPGSGNTMFSLGRQGVGNALIQLLVRFNVVEAQAGKWGILGQLSKYKERLLSNAQSDKPAAAAAAALALPSHNDALPSTHMSSHFVGAEKALPHEKETDFSAELFISTARVEA